VSEDQDLPTRPALSGRRERARLLGEDGPPAWEGDGAGLPGPADRPPVAPPRPLAPGELPRRVPGSAPGGRTAPPGVRPAEPVRLPRPADGAPSRGAFEPPPKSGEASGPPDGEPLSTRGTRQIPELKPASDSWSGAFQPTARPAGSPVGTALAGDAAPGGHPPAPSRMTTAPITGQSPFAESTRQSSPAQQTGPSPVAGQDPFTAPTRQASQPSPAQQSSSTVDQDLFAGHNRQVSHPGSAQQAGSTSLPGQSLFGGSSQPRPAEQVGSASLADQDPFARLNRHASQPGPAGQSASTSLAGQGLFAEPTRQDSHPGPAQQSGSAFVAGQAPFGEASLGSSPSGMLPPAAAAPDQVAGGARAGAPAVPSRSGQVPPSAAAAGPRSDGAGAAAPAGRPSPAGSGLTFASRPSPTDSALAPPSRRPSGPGTAGEASSTGPQTRPAGARPGAAGARPPARSPKAEPSWGSVLASTMRLWAQRRGRRWRATTTAVLVLAVAAAGVTAGTVWMTSRHRAAVVPSSSASPTAPHSPSPGASAVAAAAVIRQTAARWVTRQVNRAAIVACDPAMCSLLHNSGFPAANLVPVLPDTTDPLGADLVMATAVVRNQFGRRLTRVYAPLAIARFGTGNTRIDVRQVLPAGSSGVHARLAAKLREARQSGRELLANSRIEVSGQARTVLRLGHVDERLMATLAVLATEEPIDVLGFGDANPGAGAWVPLRSADLIAVDPDRGRNIRAYRHALLSFLRAQQVALYRATSITVLTTNSGHRIIRIAFAAPSP